MNRQMVYAGQIPQDTDILNSERNGYIGACKLAQALFGNATTVNGLSCVPNSPAALNVLVNPGEIYSLQQLDATAYGSLGTDTTDQVLKQGILMAQQTLNTPAPITTGFSINYLVQAGFIESDANSVVLPYYNAANPAVAWSGPGNSGAAQNTQRQDLCQVQVKAGTAAATGIQTTPAPDVNFVGLWVVTVAFGQSTVTSGNITAYPGAPFLHGSQNNPLFVQHNLAATTNPAVTNDNTQGYSIGSRWLNTSTNIMYVAMNVTTGAAVWGNINDATSLPTSTGSANAQAVTNVVPIKNVAGAVQKMIPGFTNTGSATLAPDGVTAATIKAWGSNLIGGELQTGVPAELCSDGTNWHLQNPKLSALGLLSGALEATVFLANGTFTPLTTGNYLVIGIGGGGSGGGGGGGISNNGGQGGQGGAGGGIGFSIVSLTAGTGYAVVIGTGGASTGGGNSSGSDGTAGHNGNPTTFNGVTIGAAGQGGSQGKGASTGVASGGASSSGGGYGGGTGGVTGSGGGISGSAGAANTGSGGGGGSGANNANAGGNGGAGGSGILIVLRA